MRQQSPVRRADAPREQRVRTLPGAAAPSAGTFPAENIQGPELLGCPLVGTGPEECKISLEKWATARGPGSVRPAAGSRATCLAVGLRLLVSVVPDVYKAPRGECACNQTKKKRPGNSCKEMSVLDPLPDHGTPTQVRPIRLVGTRILRIPGSRIRGVPFVPGTFTPRKTRVGSGRVPRCPPSYLAGWA